MLLIGAHVRDRHSLDRVRFRNVVDDQHRSGGEDGSFDFLLAELDEVVGRHSVGLIDASFIALIVECRLRQYGRAADGRDEHGIRLRSDDLEHLAGHALIVASVTLAGDDADAGFFGERAKDLEPVLAVGVVETDEAHALNAGLGHVPDQRGSDQVVVLRRLENPSSFCVDRFNHGRSAHGGEQRHFVVGDDIQDGERIGRGGRTDKRIDMVFADEFLGVLHCARGISPVLELKILDGCVADFFGQQLGRVLLRDADG